MAYAELVDVSRRLSLLSTTPNTNLIVVDPISASSAQAAPAPTDTEFTLSTVEALAAGATVTVGTETGEVASVAGKRVTLTAALTAAPAVGAAVTWRNADRRPGSVTELQTLRAVHRAEADARIDGALLEGRVNPEALPLAVVQHGCAERGEAPAGGVRRLGRWACGRLAPWSTHARNRRGTGRGFPAPRRKGAACLCPPTGPDRECKRAHGAGTAEGSWMRLFPRIRRRAAAYTDAIVEALQQRSTGAAATVEPERLAVVEAAAGLFGRLLSAAAVTPSNGRTAGLTPRFLYDAGFVSAMLGEGGVSDRSRC